MSGLMLYGRIVNSQSSSTKSPSPSQMHNIPSRELLCSTLDSQHHAGKPSARLWFFGFRHMTQQLHWSMKLFKITLILITLKCLRTLISEKKYNPPRLDKTWYPCQFYPKQSHRPEPSSLCKIRQWKYELHRETVFSGYNIRIYLYDGSEPFVSLM